MLDFFGRPYALFLAAGAGVPRETAQGQEGGQDCFVGKKRGIRLHLFMEILHDFQDGRGQDGARGTDNPFYYLMRVCSDAVLKLIGVESPSDYIAKAVVLKEKNL